MSIPCPHAGKWKLPVSMAVAAAFLSLSVARASDPNPTVDTSGPIYLDETNVNGYIGYSDFPSQQAPIFVKLTPNDSNQVTNLTVYLQGSLTDDFATNPPVDPSPSKHGSLIDLYNTAGDLTVQDIQPSTTIVPLLINWNTNYEIPTDANTLGIAAISLNGPPLGSGSDNNKGANVTLNLGELPATSDVNLVHITVSTSTPLTGTPDTVTLNPDGFRTANLSAIQAVSYGSQDSSKTTYGGGAVSVTTGPLVLIDMTTPNTGIITAGISASTAVGSGDEDGQSNRPSVTVNHSGTINNAADWGIGIMATGTGAQFPDGGGSVALGAPVTVNLIGGTISLTGQTGVGVYALSNAYPTSKAPKHTNGVQAGNVTVTLDSNSSITTGTTGSPLSIGILAVSAGTAANIDPFTFSSIDVTGSGNGGTVTVTNNGQVKTTGQMAVGIVALSQGGASLVTGANNSSSAYSYVGGGGSSEADGTGAQVTVTNNGSIITLGESAYGIAAISSGGGGLIDNAIQATFSDSTNPFSATSSGGLVIGNGSTQSGDPGHNAGGVTVTNNGSITTGDHLGTGVASIAIVAESIGGNGGSAGGHASLFVGDKGGGGGDGGTVQVTTGTSSQIKTQDVNAVGILAQSIGGGGGNGGNADGLFVAVGGRGGKGGKGGAVTTDISGSLITLADHSAGVIAQSVGGGGGHGGGATSIGVFVDASIGRQGANGGDAGLITGTLEQGATITTSGNNSMGMLMQSIGGGGGDGGAAYAGSVSLSNPADPITLLGSMSMALGGGGGAGGTGGQVYGYNYGTITTGIPLTGPSTGAPNTEGADSNGVTVQSIGGGGGHGGSAVAHSFSVQDPADPSPVSVSMAFTFGGNGGAAGNGGSVNFTNTGTITTWGDGSNGVLAQSVGGGGGDGGDSTASTTIFSGSSVKGTVTMAFGGSGGAAGDGSTVTLNNGSFIGDTTTDTIITHGQNAVGLLAQSIGGGGGSGSIGNAKANTPSPLNFGDDGEGGSDDFSATLTFGIGGNGGGGGAGGIVNVSNFGTITTTGSGSQGILAQTIGGGGGNAGGGTSNSSNNTLTINLSLGANGGTGGDGAANGFQVINSGNITTSGGDGTGILAQNIGGGGGNGGSSDATATIGAWGQVTGVLSPSTKYLSNISVGGAGGAGGAGGDVSIYAFSQDNPDDTSTVISTAGERAYGILAQSISGGGGTGGSATALSNSTFFSTPLEGGPTFELSASVGGLGGDAPNSATVTVQNSATINTAGYGSVGIFAQSIGGGGGIAADGSVDVGANLGLGINVNQAGGSSGSGGTINVSQYGEVHTGGIDAAGILAQSIGGGGGMASTGVSFFNASFIPLDGKTYIGSSLTLGFNLSTTNLSNGGTVTVTNGADLGTFDPNGGFITTAGDWSAGIVAQSVGAGGGKASTIYGTASNAAPDLTLQLGAANGQGDGGAVNLDMTNGFISTGTNSNGIATGNSGYAAIGILGQSIGGGGGLATDASSTSTGTVHLGGTSTGSSGNGGSVNLDGPVSILTYGGDAHGIVLQSIGGGGGLAGSGSSTSVYNSSASVASVQLGGKGSYGNGVSVGVNALNAEPTNVIDVVTHGNNAYGILAQSIGGGGGLATIFNGTADAHTSLGNNNASVYSDGGTVTVQLVPNSLITTTGIGAHGIVAQSIGGGGGIANADIYTAGQAGLTTGTYSAASNKSFGYGGYVTVSANNDIFTTGAGAYGIIAQTIGGGGGLIGNYAGSTGYYVSGENPPDSSSGDPTGNGTTSVDTYHTVDTSGANSTAIFAQNTTASGYGNAVNVQVWGKVNGGSGTGAGVWVDGGSPENVGLALQANQLTVGAGGSVTARSGLAVRYTGLAYLNVTNGGTITGSVDAASAGYIDNEGTFNTGAYVTGHLHNAALINPGGDSVITHTVLNSNLDSTTDAMLRFNLVNPFSYDQLNFANPSLGGSFDGSLTANFHIEQMGAYTYTLISAGDNSYTQNFQDNSIVTFDITNPGLSYSYTFFIGDDQSYNLSISIVPEPSPTLLLLLGGLGLVLVRVRGGRRKNSVQL